MPPTYRFKTLAEFVEELGESWRELVPGHWPAEMDFLLGTTPDHQGAMDDIAKGRIHQDNGRLMLRFQGLGFWVGKEMLTVIPLEGPKVKYGFKTRQEMITEFGEDWRAAVGWNSTGEMDHFLGWEPEDYGIQRSLKEVYQNKSSCKTTYWHGDDHSWVIDYRSITMITRKPEHITTKKFSARNLRW